MQQCTAFRPLELEWCFLFRWLCSWTTVLGIIISISRGDLCGAPSFLICSALSFLSAEGNAKPLAVFLLAAGGHDSQHTEVLVLQPRDPWLLLAMPLESLGRQRTSVWGRKPRRWRLTPCQPHSVGTRPQGGLGDSLHLLDTWGFSSFEWTRSSLQNNLSLLFFYIDDVREQRVMTFLPFPTKILVTLKTLGPRLAALAC